MAMRLRYTEVGLPASEQWLDGILAHHPEVPALIIQLERGGGTLKTSRGAFIKAALEEAGFATLHVGLLSHEDERKAPEIWQQVATLATRINAVMEWIRHQPALKHLPLGMVARDTAAAAMIRVAARGSTPLRALASRSGRPDLAGLEPLRSLTVPLLTVAGELDDAALGPTRQAYDLLACPKELAVIPAASHTFEELGALDEVCRRLVAWFSNWLVLSRSD